jgi:hypothetical protein
MNIDTMSRTLIIALTNYTYSGVDHTRPSRSSKYGCLQQ